MIEIKNLSHIYKNRNEEAIKNINLYIKKGENVVILGSSGSGKSTLLKCINRLVEPTSGEILINGESITHCSIKKAEKIRGRIGMIFQNFNIIEREEVFNNVLDGRLQYISTLNTILNKFFKKTRKQKDYSIIQNNIERVGLGGYEYERAANLSGGQKQRVAIARALSQEPSIMLADEPVSNLDPKLMKEIMDLLKEICKEKNITLVSSLHFLDFAKKYGERIIGMKNGEIVFDGKPEDLKEKDIVNIYGESKEWYLDKTKL